MKGHSKFVSTVLKNLLEAQIAFPESIFILISLNCAVAASLCIVNLAFSQSEYKLPQKLDEYTEKEVLLHDNVGRLSCNLLHLL